MTRIVAPLLALSLAACGQPLELPYQVTGGGHSADEVFDEPCPTWCDLGDGVRALTSVRGDVIAYEVVRDAAPWDAVMADAQRKWGAPSSQYRVTPPEGGVDIAWFEARDRLHVRHVGRAHVVLDKGDPKVETRYAVWQSGGTLVQVAADDETLRASWVITDRVY